MQKLFLMLIFSCFLLMEGASFAETVSDIQKQVNLLYRTAQEMVEHGMAGHIHEIVLYGKRLTLQTETTLEEVKSGMAGSSEGKALIAALLKLHQKTKEAVLLGEQNKGEAALSAARRASFLAKHLRDKVNTKR